MAFRVVGCLGCGQETINLLARQDNLLYCIPTFLQAGASPGGQDATLNFYLVCILAILLLGTLLELIAGLLELRSLHPELPAEFAGVYDRDRYARAQEYTRATTRLALVRRTVGLALTLAFLLLGGFNLVDALARGLGLTPVPTGLVFTGLLALLSGAVQLPFSVYATFGIEERFGLNTTTPLTFLLDTLKGLLLAVVLGGPLLAGVFLLFDTGGPAAWILCWLAVSAFLLVVQFLAPVVLLPLFNRFTPLAEDELRTAITRYAANERFAVGGIFTMDGSRRSTRANAFFTGFGRFRRIVFFDTLLERLTTAEIVAVLAHEIAHFADFVAAYGTDPNGQAPRQDQGEQGRFRRFSREWIASERGDSLDIAWLKDENAEDAADLPEPAVLAREAVEELNAAVAELEAILVELGEVA